ncbi:MAG: M48 family metalloprotease, partial [Candidatus Omnitrophica bacterium]|nr:M48 family metalloprotease [Candidatus Omnitrophota bacterium]
MRIFLFFLGITLFLSGCASAPLREKDFSSESGLLSEKDEVLFGNYVDAYITNEYSLLENKEINEKVSLLGERLALNSHRKNLKFTFRVLNEHQVNAFAGPGGYIYITRGLLDKLKTKDQLVSVLAHEIAHICCRHQLKALYNAQTAQNMIILGSILSTAAGVYTGSEAVSDLGNMVSEMITIMVYQGYSRSFEAE